MSPNYSFTSFQDFQKVVGYIGGDKYSDALQFYGDALLPCRSHHFADDSFEVALSDLDEIATLVADAVLGDQLNEYFILIYAIAGTLIIYKGKTLGRATRPRSVAAGSSPLL